VVDPTGREAETHFERISYNPVSDTSIVECRPVTGRTHQLRYESIPLAGSPTLTLTLNFTLHTLEFIWPTWDIPLAMILGMEALCHSTLKKETKTQ